MPVVFLGPHFDWPFYSIVMAKRLGSPRLHDKITDVFGADLRSLAALRIGVGLLLLIDLKWRAEDLVAHYTDFGVLPRSAFLEQAANRWFISLHVINGTWEVQAVLFCIAAAFALTLVAGYKTRIVTFVSWFLLVSLQTRNPLIGDASDVLLRIVLFWGIFLPWGVCYSIDHADHPEWENLPKRCLTWATAAYVAQIVFVYWFSALLKTGPQWRTDGTAIYFALSIDQMTTAFGQYWLQFPRLLELLTGAVLWFEIIGPLLLLSPFFSGLLRMAGILGFFLMHLSFFLCLDLGLFPWIGCISLLGFVPSGFWDKISNRLATRERVGLKIYYDQDCDFCTKAVRLVQTFLLLPQAQIIPAQNDPSADTDMQTHNSWVVVKMDGTRHFAYRAAVTIVSLSPLLGPVVSVLGRPWLQPFGEKVYRFVANHRRAICHIHPTPGGGHSSVVQLGPLADFLVPFFLLYVLLWNAATIPGSPLRFSERTEALGLMLRLDQTWNMFAPFPFTDDGWYVIQGKLKSGEMVDLLKNGAAISWEKPSSVLSTYKNYRWRKYMENLYDNYYKTQRGDYARYLCRSWNANHTATKAAEELSIIYFLERTMPSYQAPSAQKLILLHHKCAQLPPRFTLES